MNLVFMSEIFRHNSMVVRICVMNGVKHSVSLLICTYMKTKMCPNKTVAVNGILNVRNVLLQSDSFHWSAHSKAEILSYNRQSKISKLYDHSNSG